MDTLDQPAARCVCLLDPLSSHVYIAQYLNTSISCNKHLLSYLQHNNIRGVRLSGVGWCWSSFPSIHPVIRPVIRPSKFLILEEEDDGRV
jgi:hypothetical protein